MRSNGQGRTTGRRSSSATTRPPGGFIKRATTRRRCYSVTKTVVRQPGTSTSSSTMCWRRLRRSPDQRWPLFIKKLLGPTRRNGLTFPNSRGKPYTRDTYRQSIVRAIEKAGCNHWTPLQIRHNAATRWFDEAGYDVASVLLGHRDRRSTSRYIDQRLDDVLRASKKVNQIGSM